MKTFIQIKDGVGFAYVNTIGETDGVEVEFGTGEEYLNKSYANNTWGDTAPFIWFAEINHNGSILELRKTRFISDVGNNPIITPDISPAAKWVNGQWVEPVIIIPEEPQPAITAPSTEGSVDETAQTNAETTGDTIQ